MCTHGVMFRELWVSSLHPRLGCFSGSDYEDDVQAPIRHAPPPHRDFSIVLFSQYNSSSFYSAILLQYHSVLPNVLQYFILPIDVFQFHYERNYTFRI